MKVELDLYNYATKADLKIQQVLIRSNVLERLTNLKSNVDKLDTDKLENVPPNLGNLKSTVDK